MSLRWASWLALLIAAVAAGLVSIGATADATFPGSNGKIAFVRYLSGGSHIFVMNPDGSDVTRLTESPGYDFSPAWSPDGTKIAFTRAPVEGMNTNPGDIYVMSADGGGLMNLTNNPAWDQDPAWSPDGTQIAFSSNRAADDYSEIFIMGSDDSGVRQLTHDPTPFLGGGYLSMFPT